MGSTPARRSKGKLRRWKVEILCARSLKKPLSDAQTKKIILASLGAKSEYKIPRSVTEVSVVFTDNRNIRKLNRTYRGKDEATDVLSFSSLEGSSVFEFERSLGSVVISLQTARKQAKMNQVTIISEIAWLLVHGTLHLLGYDHENVPVKVAQKMRNLEARILRNLQIRPN